MFRMDIAWREGDIARSEYARPSLAIVLSSRNAIANEDINGVINYSSDTIVETFVLQLFDVTMLNSNYL